MKKIKNLQLRYKKNERGEIIFNKNIYLKKNIARIFKPIIRDRKCFFFIDKNLYQKMDLRLYCKRLKKELNADIFLLKGGEQAKSLHYFYNYINKVFRSGVNVNSYIVAIGGGTIIDLAGMISSMIYRGINFISIPTTLLASADAAISCKNALNLSGAKNLIGTYALPKKIFIETEYVYNFLDTRYFWDGFAEIIKHAIGHSRKLYNHLVNNNSTYIKKKYINKLNKKEKEEFLKDISEILLMTIQSKTELFNEKNNELQPLYHFGHTIGHALEIASKHKCFHGEAISIGMLVATELSISRNRLNKRILKDLLFLIEKFNLPKVISKKIFNQKLFKSAIKKDKRYFDGNNHFILIDKKFKISSKLTPIKYDEFYNILKKYIN